MLRLHAGVCLLFSAVLAASSADLNFEPLSEQLIDYINNVAKTTWKAGKTNRFATLDDVKPLLGARETPAAMRQKYMTKRYTNNGMRFPKEFDARTNWPNCKSITKIRDQSSCASCWAFGAVEAMSDRICIHTAGAKQVELSARDLTACCCDGEYGCYGGWPIVAWEYWVSDGLVTGGSKESNDGCLPYPFPACEHDTTGKYPPCRERVFPTPECVKSCQSSYNKTYAADKHFGDQYYFVARDEESIKQELMMFGPAEATLDVYADLLLYKSGVYQHVTDELMGLHAVRLLGWGEENGTPYWLMANSWNEDWGDQGYFKILRGKNECRVESQIVAGRVRS